LKGGPIDVLKVSDEDLARRRRARFRQLRRDAVFEVIVDLDRARSTFGRRVPSPPPRPRTDQPDPLPGASPEVSVVDSSGAGDSMTGALAAGFLNSMEPTDALRLACAAGSANVARHGLATGSADLIRRLAREVDIEMVRKL
jgi:1-phosphofructokinase